MNIQSLGEPIFGTGNIFEWQEGTIIKTYGSDIPEEWIKELGQRGKALFKAGFPVRKVGELVELDDGLGQVYERVEGQSMADKFLNRAEIDAETIIQLAHEFAETHAKIHSIRDVQVTMPEQKSIFATVLHRAEALPSDLCDAVLNRLEELPGGDRVCHGDYHPYNVLQSPRGPIVIDWNNSHIGNPLEDVARTKLIMAGFSMMVPDLGDRIELLKNAYLERYFTLRPEGQEQVEKWWPIVCAIRLLDNIPEIQDWLLEQIRTSLSK